jgi:hypothetical protein
MYRYPKKWLWEVGLIVTVKSIYQKMEWEVGIFGEVLKLGSSHSNYAVSITRQLVKILLFRRPPMPMYNQMQIMPKINPLGIPQRFQNVKLRTPILQFSFIRVHVLAIYAR